MALCFVGDFMKHSADKKPTEQTQGERKRESEVSEQMKVVS